MPGSRIELLFLCIFNNHRIHSQPGDKQAGHGTGHRQSPLFERFFDLGRLKCH